MSCIRFSTPAQRAQLARLAPEMLTTEDVTARHPAPAVTESKIRRLRLLAAHENPKIHESVASGRHAPADVVAKLAIDPDVGVRSCVARNQATPDDVLRDLARDGSEAVRGWIAVNFSVPEDVLAELAHDASPTVRALVAWRLSLGERSGQQRSGQQLVQA